jgi:preprotein translocase subunit YajC
MVVMAPLLLMVVVLFFLSRADKKKRAQIESSLKKGDRVVTRAGLIGKISEMSERTARIEIAPGVHVTMLKSAIEGLDGGDTVASAKPAEKIEKGGEKEKPKDKDDKAKEDKESPAESSKKKK